MASGQNQNASAAATASAAAETDVYQDKSFKLFIPFLHEKTTAKKVFAVLANLKLGRLGRPDGEEGDSVVLTDRVDSKGRNYKTAEVWFKHLFSRGENGQENREIFEYLSANRDNFIEVEHMPEKVLEDGTVLPRRTWRPRLDRPRKPKAAGESGPRNIGLGKIDRTKPAMLDTSDDWGDAEPGKTADEARDAVREAAAAKAAATADASEVTEDDGTGTTMTDEEYAQQVLAGGSA